MTEEDEVQAVAPVLRAEYKQWLKTGYLTPPSAFTQKELQAILTIANIGERVLKLRQHLESTWKINRTLVDIGFIRP
jgi:hypothetical protein